MYTKTFMVFENHEQTVFKETESDKIINSPRCKSKKSLLNYRITEIALEVS